MTECLPPSYNVTSYSVTIALLVSAFRGGLHLIKEALLGLLATEPLHGYDLKVGLDRLLGGASPVNVGQVYTAIAKLERDGLIEATLVTRPSRDQQRVEMKVYHLTPEGLQDLHRWFAEPVEKVDLRDELFVKLTLARRTGRAEVAAIVRSQRTACLRGIQELTALKERLRGPGGDQGKSSDEEIDLLIEGAILHLEADLKWLDLWNGRGSQGDRGSQNGPSPR